MEYILIEGNKYTLEGLKHKDGDTEYSISGMFRNDEYQGHLQFSYRKDKDRIATTMNNTGYKGFIFVSPHSETEFINDERAREELGKVKENFLSIKEEMSSDKYRKFSKMLEDIEKYL